MFLDHQLQKHQNKTKVPGVNHNEANPWSDLDNL